MNIIWSEDFDQESIRPILFEFTFILSTILILLEIFLALVLMHLSQLSLCHGILVCACCILILSGCLVTPVLGCFMLIFFLSPRCDL